MKKSLLILASLVSINTLANQQPTPETTQKAPMLRVAVYDTSSAVSRDIGLTYSRSNKNHSLCWTAFNMQFSPTNQNEVTQVFTSPSSEGKFSSPDTRVTVSEDGKTHTLVSILPASNNEFVQQCWRFDDTDALGKYTLGVKVNDIYFEPVQIELVK